MGSRWVVIGFLHTPVALLAVFLCASKQREDLSDGLAGLRRFGRRVLARSPAPRAEPCSCLDWEKVYNVHGVSCGEGSELYLAGVGRGASLARARQQGSVVEELCLGFFERIAGSACVNRDLRWSPALTGAQWCYVHADCTALYGGRRVRGTDVSWKTCFPGEDEQLSDRPLGALVDLSAAWNVDLALLVKLAYPVIGPFDLANSLMLWDWRGGNSTPLSPSEAEFVVSRIPNNEAMAAWLHLLEFANSGQYVVLDTETHHPPFFIGRGRQRYMVHNRPDRNDQPRTWNGVTCTRDCKAGAPAAPEMLGICSCLPWQEVYRQHGTACGRGHELFFAGGARPAAAEEAAGLRNSTPMYEDMCTHMFERLNSSACVNVNALLHAPGQWHSEQWCYVRAGCEDLRGGHAVPGSQVSWKLCDGSSGDDLLRKRTPEQLASMAFLQGLDLSALAKLAYSVVGPVNATQAEVLWAWNVERRILGPPEAGWVGYRLRNLLEAGLPAVLDTKEHEPPLAVAWRSSLYILHNRPGALPESRGTWRIMSCIRGCKGSSVL